MSEWKQISDTKIVPMYRSGWQGLWDHFVALIMQREQTTIAVPLTFSIWIKDDGTKTFGAQIEEQDRE